MKSIPNKITGIPKPDGKSGNASFADLLRGALDVPPQGGFTISIMRAHARVDEALDKAQPGGVIELEDADYEVAKKAVGSCPWLIRSPDLLELFNVLGL
jgi:hypothetical protein